VGGPARVHLVTKAMEPVVEEVDAQEAGDPRSGRGLGDREGAMVLVEVQVAAQEDGLREGVEDLVEDPAREVVHGIGEPIGVPLQDASCQELDRDEREEDGNGEDDQVHLADSTTAAGSARSPAGGGRSLDRAEIDAWRAHDRMRRDGHLLPNFSPNTGSPLRSTSASRSTSAATPTSRSSGSSR
jgi:hypothetical protein